MASPPKGKDAVWIAADHAAPFFGLSIQTFAQRAHPKTEFTKTGSAAIFPGENPVGARHTIIRKDELDEPHDHSERMNEEGGLQHDRSRRSGAALCQLDRLHIWSFDVTTVSETFSNSGPAHATPLAVQPPTGSFSKTKCAAVNMPKSCSRINVGTCAT
jgi:hypothetical protein